MDRETRCPPLRLWYPIDPLRVAVTSEMSNKSDHPSAYLSISLSDEHQILYYQTQVRQACAPQTKPGISDHSTR